jgi:hypothetical protein
MTFKPLSRPDRWHALLLILGLLLLDLLLVRAGSLLVAGYLGYRTVGAFTLEYWVDRDGVTLVWGVTRQIIPMTAIRRVQRGDVPVGLDRLRVWHWPYTERRRLWGAEVGVVSSYATRPLTEQMILVTEGESYGISPADPAKFLAAIQSRYALGIARPKRAELQRPPLWTWRLWRDRVAQVLIVAGLAGVLFMFGILAFRYPSLPADVPLHFDVNGIPDRIDIKSGLFALPFIGMIIWLVDLVAGIWLYRRYQLGAAYLLWGGALIVQAIAALALLSLIR